MDIAKSWSRLSTLKKIVLLAGAGFIFGSAIQAVVERGQFSGVHFAIICMVALALIQLGGRDAR